MRGLLIPAAHFPFMTLQFVIDRPASDCDPYAVCIGPTRVDFSELSPTQLAYLFQHEEQKHLSAWKAQDLAGYYREIRRRDIPR